jgi:hypothetical protein
MSFPWKRESTLAAKRDSTLVGITSQHDRFYWRGCIVTLEVVIDDESRFGAIDGAP